MDVNLFFHNVGELLSRMGQLFQVVLGWLGQMLVVLGSVVGIIVGFVFIVVAYIVVGALLEYWLRWAWAKKRLILPMVTLVAWLPVAAVVVAMIGAVPLTLGWWGLDVDWAILIGSVAVLISIVINIFTNPLERPRKWIIAEYRRVRPVPPPAPVYKQYRSTFNGQLNLRILADDTSTSQLVLNKDDLVELADLGQSNNGFQKMQHRIHGVGWIKIRRLEAI